jgi:hypothetical protein
MISQVGTIVLVLHLAFRIDPASGLRLVSPSNPPARSLHQTEWGSGDALVLDAPSTKLVILTEINTQYMKTGLFQNWLYYAIPYLNKTVSLVFDCTEESALQELLKFTLPVDAYLLNKDYKLTKLYQPFSDLDSHKHRNDPFGYGTKNYKEMMIRRPKAIHTLLKRHFSVLLIDLDTVWVKDPFVQLHKAGLQRDLLVTSDGPRICGCFLFFRSGPQAIEIASEWTTSCMTTRAVGNQVPLNVVLGHTHERGWDVGTLPMDQFPPGNQATKYKHATVYHANWLAGSEHKVTWLKGHNLWHEPTDTFARSLPAEDPEEIFKA